MNGMEVSLAMWRCDVTVTRCNCNRLAMFIGVLATMEGDSAQMTKIVVHSSQLTVVATWG